MQTRYTKGKNILAKIIKFYSTLTSKKEVVADHDVVIVVGPTKRRMLSLSTPKKGTVGEETEIRATVPGRDSKEG